MKNNLIFTLYIFKTMLPKKITKSLIWDYIVIVQSSWLTNQKHIFASYPKKNLSNIRTIFFSKFWFFFHKKQNETCQECFTVYPKGEGKKSVVWFQSFLKWSYLFVCSKNWFFCFVCVSFFVINMFLFLKKRKVWMIKIIMVQ
jgi:hypothetical protein